MYVQCNFIKPTLPRTHTNLVSFYGAKEIQVSLVWNPTMDNEHLIINHCGYRKQAENVLQKL